MSRRIKPYSLKKEEVNFILKCIAEFWTYPQTIGVFKERFGKDFHKNTYYFYANSEKWFPVIEKIRNKEMSKLSNVAGFHKYVRLKRSDVIHDKCMDKGDESTALRAVEQSRKEVEGDKNSGDTYNSLQIQFNAMSDEEIEKRKEQLLNYLKKNKQIVDIKTEGEE